MWYRRQKIENICIYELHLFLYGKTIDVILTTEHEKYMRIKKLTINAPCSSWTRKNTFGVIFPRIRVLVVVGVLPTFLIYQAAYAERYTKVVHFLGKLLIQFDRTLLLDILQHMIIHYATIFNVRQILYHCDITAHTVLLYVLFCFTYMYCTLYILYILRTVHTVHVSQFPMFVRRWSFIFNICSRMLSLHSHSLVHVHIV